jgi:hypothetical protein
VIIVIEAGNSAKKVIRKMVGVSRKFAVKRAEDIGRALSFSRTFVDSTFTIADSVL